MKTTGILTIYIEHVLVVFQSLNMVSAAASVSLISSAIILLAAYIYFPYQSNQVDLKVVLSGLLQAEAMVQVSPETKIAVGFGSCLDVVGNGLHVLEKLGNLVPNTPENFKEIHNMDELMKTFAYFFMHGASAGYVRFACNAD